MSRSPRARIPTGGRRPHLNPHTAKPLLDHLDSLPVLIERQDLRALLGLTDIKLSEWLGRHELECLSSGGRELYRREQVRTILTEAKSTAKIKSLRGDRFPKTGAADAGGGLAA
jgi:hypothetical protein